MTTPQEIRQIRLKNDYKEMCNIRGPIIQWRATKGTEPYVEAYQLTVKIRSIVGRRPDYRDQHTINVVLSGSYPLAAPTVTMVSDPVIFHPNWWFNNRTWCYGSWFMSEGLGHHVIRMLRTLQFDPDITNEGSAANSDANTWYLVNRGGNIFPCDKQTLPDPMKSKFEIQNPVKKKFIIQ